MFFMVFAAVAAALAYALLRRPPRLLSRGKPQQQRFVHIGTRRYYIETAAFADYHQALHHYFHIVSEIEKLDKLEEVKYDFMDWTNALMRFRHFNIHLVRVIDKIHLIKSDMPMRALPNLKPTSANWPK